MRRRPGPEDPGQVKHHSRTRGQEKDVAHGVLTFGPTLDNAASIKFHKRKGGHTSTQLFASGTKSQLRRPPITRMRRSLAMKKQKASGRGGTFLLPAPSSYSAFLSFSLRLAAKPTPSKPVPIRPREAGSGVTRNVLPFSTVDSAAGEWLVGGDRLLNGRPICQQNAVVSARYGAGQDVDASARRASVSRVPLNCVAQEPQHRPIDRTRESAGEYYRRSLGNRDGAAAVKHSPRLDAAAR